MNKINNKLKMYVHPPLDSDCQIQSWPIEASESIDETARISIEDENYSYSIYFDGAGNPRLNIWSKMIDGDLDKEIINRSLNPQNEILDELKLTAKYHCDN